MKTIYKYQLDENAEQQVVLPVGAQILDIQQQENIFCLWALVNPNKDLLTSSRTIERYDTGFIIPKETNKGWKLHYISTIHLEDSGLVWHFFERTK